jgi:hypothetical protein
MANEKFRKKEVKFKMIEKKKAQPLNETAQVGDKVTYSGKRGYIIGQAQNGDWLVQIQGSSDFVNPKDVKVMGMKAKTMEPPFKFDEKTQKVLFEKYVRCGIFMGNIPVKTTNCVVKYSQWVNAQVNENVNVYSDGNLTQMQKENVRVFEDPNDFANPQDYVEGSFVNEMGDNEDILVNSIDFTAGIGDAGQVQIIRHPESAEPPFPTDCLAPDRHGHLRSPAP